MLRLLPCPSCGRHVRASERECPFCGHAEVTVTAPSRWSVALLGLCLAACSSSKDAPAQTGAPSKSETPEVAPEPAEPEPAEAEQPEAEQPEAEQPEPEAPSEAGPPDEAGSVGTTDGSTTNESEPATKPKPVPKPKYGAPRPPNKYGAPPKPMDPF
ncbi:MAG: hypothetical protein R6X02_14845 [Enhygromyxa sp.]